MTRRHHGRLSRHAALAVLLATSGAPLVYAQGAVADQAQGFYQKVCARCHEAGIGPVLKGRGLPEATFVAIARNGSNGMPAFRVSDVDDATLKEVARYLAQSRPERQP